MVTQLLGFKTELKLNNAQRTQMAKHCGVARHSWNVGLALTKAVLGYNKEHPEDKQKFPTAIDLHKWLVAVVKPQFPWYYEVSKCAGQNALRNLSQAWDRCFKKVSKPPKFKKKGRHDSFTLNGTIKVVDHFKIQLPRIGVVKTYERLPYGFKPKSVTISRQADRWFISWKIEVNIEPTPKTTEVVGVDLGVKNLATLSTGEVVEGAKAYRRLESKLRRLQWLNRNKQVGSANWRKTQIKIARLHRRIANIRKDTLHKLTTYLATTYSKIVVEDLNVSGMMSNHKLAKAVQDMGFYEFKRQLRYKCELYGSELFEADRWFASSKICSNCGHKKERLSLSERVYNCEHCGLKIDRDLNAALNLAALASS